MNRMKLLLCMWYVYGKMLWDSFVCVFRRVIRVNVKLKHLSILSFINRETWGNKSL
jgi:hypothetical protein